MKHAPILALLSAFCSFFVVAEPGKELFELDLKKPAKPAAAPQQEGQPNPHAGMAVSDEVLTGEIDPQAMILQQIPMGRSYLEYQVNAGELAALKGYDLETEVTVILGSWEPGSQRWVPGFIKIQKALDNRHIKVRYIGVDQEGQAGGMTVATKDTEKLPTFVFRRDGEEIGRITQGPEVSLEADLVNILAVK